MSTTSTDWIYGSEVFVVTSTLAAWEIADRRAKELAASGYATRVETTWFPFDNLMPRSYVVYYRVK